MNRKIFHLLTKNLQQAFGLARHAKIRDSIGANTVVDALPWTPARYRKFRLAMTAELALDSDYVGTVQQVVADLDRRYLMRFFGEIWKPRTDSFNYTGWQLAEEINKLQPRSVLDVGCGYHPYKGRINNIVGIDPFNNCADYQVDILDYRVPARSHDVILALGSINFNSQDEIEQRFAHCVNLLAPGGRFYLRANPGLPHATGPYVDVFEWTFAVVKQLELTHGLHLETFKQDSNGRLYFVYSRPQ